MKQNLISDVVEERIWIEVDVQTLKSALKRKKANDKQERVKKALKRKE